MQGTSSNIQHSLTEQIMNPEQQQQCDTYTNGQQQSCCSRDHKNKKRATDENEDGHNNDHEDRHQHQHQQHKYSSPVSHKYDSTYNQQQQRCRICYQPTYPLISVCGCMGSIAYVHEDCVLDWITKKIQNAQFIEIPKCQVCHQRYSARLKAGEKKLCYRLLMEKFGKQSIMQKIMVFVNILVFMLALVQIFTFLYSTMSHIWSSQSAQNSQTLVSNSTPFYEFLIKIFTNLICQIYTVYFIVKLAQSKKWMIEESMVQIVQVTLQPKIIVRKPNCFRVK